MKRKSTLICNTCLLLLLGVPLAIAQAALEKRTSLDVNAVPPADVFGSLAQILGCGLEIDPAVHAPLTVRLTNITVRTALNALCESIGCGWRLAGNTLRINATPTPKYERPAPESFRRLLEQQTPADFKFQNVPLKSVLDALGKVSGVEISADEPEASRLVTMDLSGRSVMSALKEIGQSAELKAGIILASISKEPGRSVRIKLAPRGAYKGAKKLPAK